MPIFKSRFAGLPAAAVLLMVLLSASVVSACPTCKDSLMHDDPQAQTLVQGYFWSILFMMAMPFVIFGGLSSYFYFQIRKARRLHPGGWDAMSVNGQGAAGATQKATPLGAWEAAT